MQRLLIVIGLEVYALAAAFLQLSNGVRTDEAKYLLNIPYPHPPLARSIISFTETIPHHELFWRVVFATLLVQAVWLVYDLARTLPKSTRIVLCGGWLLSAAVIIQAGTIMMAVLTALQGLVFVWLLLKHSAPSRSSAGIIALFWLTSLFTAYQAALFFPLVWAVLRRTGRPRWLVILLWLIPLCLLDLYTLSNPLALASMVIHAGKDITQTLGHRLQESLLIAGLGGSIVLTVTGVLGMVRARQWALLLSLILVSGYVLLSRYEYYAILFTPLVIAGTYYWLQHERLHHRALLLAQTLCTVLLLVLRPPLAGPENAKTVMQAVDARRALSSVLIDGHSVLIAGSFGHEWQYRSRLPVLRYHPSLLGKALAVVCLTSCEGMESHPEFVPIEGLPVETWVRR